MATVREGNKGVLLVVDVQVGVMHDAWDAPRVIQNVARTVERARAQGVPVIWVQHADHNLVHGSPQWQWVPELVPAPGEPLIHKQFNSSFEQTGLDLSSLGMPGCQLQIAPEQVVFRASAGGAAQLDVPIPAIASLAGVELFTQALVFQPGVNPFGAVVSNGSRMVVGTF